jgi:hypothetical protein
LTTLILIAIAMLRKLIQLLAAGIVLLASSNVEVQAREDIGSLTRRLRSRGPPVRRSPKASIKSDDDYRYQNDATSGTINVIRKKSADAFQNSS